MAQFRKRPIVIEAEQFDGTLECAERLASLYGSNVWPTTNWVGEFHGTLTINTLEGLMTASAGDWIITGVAGERYPCRSDIFEKTYEPVS